MRSVSGPHLGRRKPCNDWLELCFVPVRLQDHIRFVRARKDEPVENHRSSPLVKARYLRKALLTEVFLMKTVGFCYIFPIILMFLAVSVTAQNAFTPQQKTVISGFEDHAKDYIKLRERIDNTLPNLPKKATKEQIQAHHDALLKGVQHERFGAKQGDIFTPEASVVIRQMIKDEFKGRDRADLRKRVFEGEDTKVRVKVNVEYPESKEVMDMPPQLLLTLPQLPKQLKYRLVGTYLLLVDRENEMIVDYMTNALP